MLPGGRRDRVSRNDFIDVLRQAKEGAIGFIHLGCCEMVDKKNRRSSLTEIADASGARWVSRYTTSIDWLRSMFLDLALVAEVYLEFAKGGNRPSERSSIPNIPPA